MAAAADKRLQQEESRGMKDPEGYKRKLEQREKLENQSNTAGTGEAPLKVSFVIHNIHLHLFQSDICIRYFYYMKLYFVFQWQMS